MQVRVPYRYSGLFALVLTSGLFFFASSRSRAGDVIRGQFSKPVTAATADAPLKLRFQLFLQPKHKSALVPMAEALEVVLDAAPKGVVLEGDASGNFEFVIEVTDAKPIDADGLEPHRSQRAILEGLADDVAHYTLIPAHAPRGPYIVRLFWDRLAYEEQNGHLVERPDAFTRIVTALVHEIYGNVRTAVSQRKLLEDPQHRYSDTFIRRDQILFEREAYRAGVDALTRVKETARAAELSTTGMLAQIDRALFRETLALARWNKATVNDVSTYEKPVPTVLTGTAQVASLGVVRCERLFVSK